MGVARIELMMPAMSRQRAVVILSFEISLIEKLLGALAQYLPNSPTVELPSGLKIYWMTALTSQIVDVCIGCYPGR